MRVLLVCSLLLTIFVKDVHGQALYPTSTGGVGAVYTMTNGGVGNQILVHSLTANGVLTKANNVSTNGTGVNTTANSPLFSQGALIVYSNYLFAVNPGSNSLSMFMISPSDATQLTLLSVRAAYGTFPVSITANDMYVCVLTGGSMTGIRCFTYNSSGLTVQASFDRNLTSYISQTIPPTGPALTMSEILFSADNAALIVSIKGFNSTRPGRLLFYPLSNNRTTLAATPTEVMPTGGIHPASMTLVGSNGLLVTDPGAAGVLTLTYSSSNGSTANSILTAVNTTMANTLSWSTYSSKTGNYYVIGAAGAAPVVELKIDMTSATNPVQIVRYYSLAGNTSALDATVVSLAGTDYLYVLGVTASGITGYQLFAAGNATSMAMVVSQTGNTSSVPKLVGLAAFVQTRSATSAAASLFFSTVTVMMSTVLLVFICE